MTSRRVKLVGIAVVATLVPMVMPARTARADGPTCTTVAAKTEVNGSGCPTVTPPPLAGSITVNGTEGSGEWSGAVSLPLAGDFTGTIKLLRSTTTLYLLISMNVSPPNPADSVEVHFDTWHNHATVTDDVSFRIVRVPGPTLMDTKTISPGGTGAWTPAAGVLGRTSTSLQWMVELALPDSELGVTGLPSIMGFGIKAVDFPEDNVAVWPPLFDPGAPSSSWANLKTRYPIQFDIVLDQSGSMLSSNKWTNAKTAANFLANTMSIFKDPYFDDQIGVVTFAWPCSGSTDGTASAKPLATVPAFPAGDYMAGVADPASNNCTPIGKGLSMAFSSGRLDAGTDTTTKQRDRQVLLLSDGLQNRPSSTFTAGETGYDPCSASDWDPCTGTVPNVTVSTVAFGTGDWEVDTARLSEIKDRYGGEFASTYNLSSEGEDLKGDFISALIAPLRVNLVTVDSGPGANPPNFVVDPGVHKLAVILSWTTASAAATMVLQRDTGGGSFSDVTPACTTIAETSTVGYATCVATDPVAGTYRVRASGGATPAPFSTAPSTQFVVVDLTLRARFGIEPGEHGTGGDLILKAELLDAGLPLTDDATHPVTVTAQLDQPEEGLGDFVVTHSPEDCEKIRPTIPRVDSKTFSGISLSGQPGTTLLTHLGAAAPTGQADPDPQLYALAAQLLKACGKGGLQRSAPPTIELVDDGTGADAVANDGVYTARYAGTDFEGSYVFRFHAEGLDLTGAAFTRTQRLAEYVRPEVDAGHTKTDSLVLQTNGSTIAKAYFVLPADGFGRYLGPGRIDQVQFVANSGQWLTPVIDLGNGYYGRVLSFNRTLGEPDVIPVVQGKPMVRHHSCLLPWWLWLIIVLILLLVVLWLWILLRRCRKVHST
jgi:hypothetical protein